MSITAVFTALVSSSLLAFDTDGGDTGPDRTLAGSDPILVQGTTQLAGYQGNLNPFSGGLNDHPPKESTSALRISALSSVSPSASTYPRAPSGRGDALIFPLFNQKDDWGTEIVVRNTNKFHAVVAKVAIYDKKVSEEVLDFNLYLSATDVARFRIENGKVVSGDGSILRDFPDPASNLNDVDENDFASEANPFTAKLASEAGYIIVYGMAQASTDDDATDSHGKRYHNQHARLFANYRRELDYCRSGWRIGHHNAMVKGTYTRRTTHSAVDNYSVAAPNQKENCRTDTKAAPGNFFGDVDPILTGTVRLYNASNNPRDMVLPATAIENFTDKNKIIWTEGEIANLQDRRIQGTQKTAAGYVDDQWASYNEEGVRADAYSAFKVANTAYTFNADSIANQLVITQPYKRVLVQMGNDDGYWQDVNNNFGGFAFIYNLFNEDERMINTAYTTSPYDSKPICKNDDKVEDSLCRDELESMSNLEKGSAFEKKNGFALIRFTGLNGRDSIVPAVITQMIGSVVGDQPQVNWVYSQTDMFLEEQNLKH